MFRDKYLMTLYAELDDLLIRMGKVLGFHSQRSTDTMDANGFLILCYKEKMQEQGYHHHPTKSDHRPKGTMRCPTLHQSWNITNLVTKLMDRQTILKSRNAIADYRLPRTLERVVYLYGDGSNTAKCSSSISWTSSSNSVQGWDSEAPKNSTYGMGEGLNIRSRHGDKELVQPVRKIVDKFVEMLHMLYPSTSHPKEKTVPIGAMRSITWQQFPFDQMERSSIPRFTVSSLFGMKLFTSSSVANDTLTGIIKQINLQAIVRGDLMLVFPTTLSNSNASSLYHSQIHRRKKNNQTTGTCLLGEEEEDVQNLFEKIEHVVQAILMVKPSTSCRIDR
jgi:hypothetical protein